MPTRFSTILDNDWIGSGQYETQRKLFRNPRGMKYYYCLGSSTKRIIYVYKSPDGINWVVDALVKDYGVGVLKVESFDWAYREDPANNQLVVYITWADDDGNLFYRRGTIADDSTTVVLGSEQQLKTGTANDKWNYPAIAVDVNGYIYIVFRRYGLLLEEELLYCNYRLLVADRDGWTKVGAEPYLDAVDAPANYVYTDIKGDTIGDFLFESPTMLGEIREIQCYLKGDGDDYIEVYIHDGSVWTYAGTMTPSTAYEWRSIDVSAILDTAEKLEKAKMYMVKRTVGKVGVISVDCARIRVAWSGVTRGYSVRIIASTVPDTPTATDWSDELILWETGDDPSSKYAWATIEAFYAGAGVDVLVASKRWDPVKVTVMTIGLELSWDGAKWTFGKEVEWEAGSSDSMISIAIDTDNIAYVTHKDYWLEIHCRRWQPTVGWLPLEYYVVNLADPLAMSSMIDTSTTPHRHVVFLRKEGTLNTIRLRVKNVDVWDEPWTIVGEWDDTAWEPWGAEIYHMNAFLKDDEGRLAVTYNLWSEAIGGGYIRYFEWYPVVPVRMVGDSLTWVTQ